MAVMPKLKVRYVIATMFLAAFFYFALSFLFVGYSLEHDIEKSKKEENARIQRILDENPEFAEKYRAWKAGELELTQDEVEEQIYKVLFPHVHDENGNGEESK